VLHYKFIALYRNEELQKYFAFLETLAEKRQNPKVHFSDFRKVAHLLEQMTK
jgi:hypothetical protein